MVTAQDRSLANLCVERGAALAPRAGARGAVKRVFPNLMKDLERPAK